MFAFLQTKAVEFSKMQICVDLFLFSAQYTDVATLVNLPKFTAGQLFYYPVRIPPVESFASVSCPVVRPDMFSFFMLVFGAAGSEVQASTKLDFL